MALVTSLIAGLLAGALSWLFAAAYLEARDFGGMKQTLEDAIWGRRRPSMACSNSCYAGKRISFEGK